MANFVRGWKIGSLSGPKARINFASPELLWQVLTAEALGTVEGSLRRRLISIH
jgi:hypothetical protein